MLSFFQTFIMEHNKVQKIPFGAFSKAKFLVRVNHEPCNRLQTLFQMVYS